jgi:hypothetical protein
MMSPFPSDSGLFLPAKGVVPRSGHRFHPSMAHLRAQAIDFLFGFFEEGGT